MSKLSTLEVTDERLGTNEETLPKGRLDDAIDDSPDVGNCTEVTETSLGTSSRVEPEKPYENSLSPKLKSILTPILDAGHRLWNAAKYFAQREETVSEPEIEYLYVHPSVPSLSYEYIQNETQKLDLNNRSDSDIDTQTLCGDDEAQKYLNGDELSSSGSDTEDEVKTSKTKAPKKPPRKRLGKELKEACLRRWRRLSSSPVSSLSRKKGHSKKPEKEETAGPSKRLFSGGRKGSTYNETRSPRLKATRYLKDIPKVEEQLLSYLERSLKDLLNEIISNPEANVPLLVECIMDLPLDYNPERNLISAAYHEISQTFLHCTEEDFVCLVFWETVNQLSHENQVAKGLCYLLNQDLKNQEAQGEETDKAEEESTEASTAF